MNPLTLTHEHSSAQRISKARTLLIMDHPFFGSLSLKLKLVRDDSAAKTLKTATDGRALYYADEYVRSLTDAQLLGEIAHLVMHPAMQHHTRRHDRDLALWNDACDQAINGPLLEAGFELPEGFTHEARFSGKNAEAIYSTLLEERQQQQQQEPDDDEQNDQQSSGAGSGGASGADTSGDEGTQPQEQSGGASGIADKPGAFLDAPDLIEDSADWQLAAKQAAQVAQGQLPANIARLTAEANRPKFDAEALLLRFAQERAADDYSWRRPNKRYVQQGVYLPEIDQPALGEVVLVIDSSGSINNEQCAKFVGICQRVVDQVHPRSVRVIVSDARVHADHRFEKHEAIEGVKLIGGGGTDFRPAFRLINEDDDAPACIIYLTDGHGTYPAEYECAAPTLWCMTTDKIAPHGETVRLED